jgi:hypothetical protein
MHIRHVGRSYSHASHSKVILKECPAAAKTWVNRSAEEKAKKQKNKKKNKNK